MDALARATLADIHTYCDGPFCRRIQRHEVHQTTEGYQSSCSRCFVTRPATRVEVDEAHNTQAWMTRSWGQEVHRAV